MTSNNTRQPDERERAVEALRRRIAGETYQEIADALGYSDRSGSRRAVQRLLDRREAESVDELRAVHGARLEALVATYFGPATKGDTDAAMVVLRAHDRLAKLFGTNMPDRVEVGATVTDVEFAEQAAALIGELSPEGLRAAFAAIPGGTAAARSAAGEGTDPGEQDSPASVEHSAGNDDGPEPWADVDGPEPVARQGNTDADGVVEPEPEPAPVIPPAGRPDLARRAAQPYGPPVALGGFAQRLGGNRPTVVVHNEP